MVLPNLLIIYQMAIFRYHSYGAYPTLPNMPVSPILVYRQLLTAQVSILLLSGSFFCLSFPLLRKTKS